MKRYLLILVLFLPCARLIAQVQQVRVAHTYAIVIGISQYSKENNLPSLKYAHRDAEEFARYLQSPAGGSVPTEHIILLKNEEATLAAVDNALYQVRDSTGTNDLVYFYFAGHGDKQTSFHDNLGFLLTYNTPRFNYLNNALRIEDLNDFADGLSISNKANVVLITDACHSGDLAINGFRGSPMVNEALRSVKNKEIRITSCDTDQLSVEGPDWGGGRGVFSWYLVNGLKGYASRNGQGNINLGDLQVYLDSCFAVDRVLDEDQQKEHARKQNPVLKGNTGFILARMDTQALAGLRKMSIGQPGKFSISTALRPLPIQPADLFFQYLKMQPIEARLNFFLLDSLKPSEIPIACIDQLLTNKLTDGFRDTMNTLKASLQTDKDKLN